MRRLPILLTILVFITTLLTFAFAEDMNVYTRLFRG
jgi:hypothetical protein